MTIANVDDVLEAGYPQTQSIPASTSTLLSAIFGAFPSDTLRVILIPHGGNVYINKTTASTSSPLIPSGGLELRINATESNLLAVYAASSTLDLYVFGPRS